MNRLTEEALSSALRQAVPEPDEDPLRALAARTRARSIRHRRWGIGTALAVVLISGTAASAVAITNRTGTSPAAGHDRSPTASTSACHDQSSCDALAAASAIAKPLHLPQLSPGDACPVSPVKHFAAGGGFSGPFDALGPGPLYIAGPGAPDLPTVGLQPDTASGQDATKTIWVIDGGYSGPLLLRGARIDGTGTLGFDAYLGTSAYPGTGSGDDQPQRQLLYLQNGLGASPSPGLTTYPSGLFIDPAGLPGCYAMQIDGEGFSEILVFKADRG